MNIEELKNKKEEAAKEIFYILNRFEQETKISIESISLTSVKQKESNMLVGVNLHLDL